MTIITKKSKINQIVDKHVEGVEVDELDPLNFSLILFGVAIPLTLWFALQISAVDHRETIELLVPLIFMLVACLVGAFIPFENWNLQRRTQTFVGISSLIVIASELQIMGHGRFPYLWQGFGLQIVLLAAVVTLAMLLRIPSLNFEFTNDHVKLKRVISVTGLSTIVALYVPSFIQPAWGIINMGDATHQVLEEISGPLVGNFPGVNAVSTYTTLLGIPLVPIRWFNLDNQIKMSIVLIWVNLLVIATPVFMVLIVRTLSRSKSWLLSTLVVIPTLMVSGNWAAASTNAESLSIIPGRTFLPIVLGYFLIKSASTLQDPQSSNVPVFIGAFGVAVAMNNIEFGLPALVSMFLVSLFMGLFNHQSIRSLIKTCSGVVIGFIAYVMFSFAVDGPYDFKFRIGSYAGKPYSPSEIFPVISVHNVFLALFASAIVSGLHRLRLTKRATTSSEFGVATCAMYFGIWGFTSFPYCSYRCVEGLYMSTQIYLVPAIMCACSLVLLYIPSLQSLKEFEIRRRIRYAPLLFLCAFSVSTLLQVPNPRDEWRRISNSATSTGWSSDVLRGVPDQWNSETIDWINTKVVQEFALQIGSKNIGYFGYMGNSVELATGIDNLTRINSGEVLQIKGTDQIRKLACVGVDQKKPEFVIVYGIDFFCQGYQLVDDFQSTTSGLIAYIKMS